MLYYADTIGARQNQAKQRNEEPTKTYARGRKTESEWSILSGVRMTCRTLLQMHTRTSTIDQAMA